MLLDDAAITRCSTTQARAFLDDHVVLRRHGRRRHDDDPAAAWRPSVGRRSVAGRSPVGRVRWAYANDTMFASILERRWEAVSDTVAKLTGRPPLPFDAAL